MSSEQTATERYQVKPGSKVKMADWSTRDKKLYDMPKEDSWDLLHGLRRELQALQKMLYAQGKHKVLIVIQAMDTGGKDGCIRHVFSNVDPQGITVTPFKAPSSEERAHDYLWRIHEHTPANGHIAVFNRSHYEDIIAVRVKKLAPEEVWKKRYEHIVNFEKMLTDEGTLILKFYLNISNEEQRERLQARLDDPAKHWKFNPDDLKDRARWGEFMDVYEEVISKTSSEHAPWFMIPADRKWYRNLVVAEIVRDALKRLDMEYPEISWDPETVQID